MEIRLEDLHFTVTSACIDTCGHQVMGLKLPKKGFTEERVPNP